MSIVQEILYILHNYPGGYRVLYDLIYDGKKPGENKKSAHDKINPNTLRVALSRLKKQGLVVNDNSGVWELTKTGRELFEKKKFKISKFSANSKEEKRRKEMIVVFDIPENERKYRDWLRIELISFGFEPIQKSVWFGPKLPEAFIKHLSECGILQYVRFFRAKEEDLI